MRTWWISLLAVIATAAGGSNASALNLAAFTTCVQAVSSGSTCQLDSGVWSVTSPIVINGDNITITGTTNDASDAVLQRTSTLGLNPIMEMGGAHNVTINWLTFDGNRSSVSVCSTSDFSVSDLDLGGASVATLQYLNFIRAPYRALGLAGSPSTVSYSNWGQGFNAHSISLTGPQTATRWYGVIFTGDSSGVWDNNFSYVGLPAIMSFSGTTQYIVGNQLYMNRYEQPDGVSGGQIYVQDAPTYLSVATNVIDGGGWYTTGKNTGNTDILCNPNSGLWPFAIEASGTGHRYYNNAIQNNYGFGMLLRPWNSSEALDSNIISGYDPFCTGTCTYVPHYITNNATCWSLASCYGSGWPASMGVAGININDSAASSGPNGTVSNITFDHVRSTNNIRNGVSIYNASGTPGFTDSVNGSNYACISGNGTNLTTSGSASGYTSFSNLCPSQNTADSGVATAARLGNLSQCPFCGLRSG